MMMRMLTGSLIPCVALVACGGSEPAPQPPQPSLSFIGGVSQTDTVGRTLPSQLRVQLIDANSGAPLGGYVINWSTVDGGSLFVPVTQTGTNGITSNVFTLGTRAGSQRVVAKYIDPQTATPITLDTVYATAVPARALYIRLIPGWQQLFPQVTLGDTVWVYVRYDDQYANDGAACPDNVPWQNLTWTYDSSVVQHAGYQLTSDGVDTKFATTHTGSTYFSVKTDCAIGLDSVRSDYGLGVAP